MSETKAVKVARISATIGVVGSALTIASDLLSKAAALSEKWQGLQKNLPQMSDRQLVVALTLFVVLGAVAWYLSRGPRSQLKRPQAFNLNPGLPQHLKGREQDLAALTDKCIEARLVNLTGESGAGKSALVKSGLVPALRENGPLHPLYVEYWGEDWEQGPRDSLLRALRGTLSEKEQVDIGLKVPSQTAAPLGGDEEPSKGTSEPATPQDIFQLLATFEEKLGRTPLLIFDQVDDYQLQHRGRFLTNNGFLKKPKSIATSNAFWKGVSALVGTGAAHVLLVTRADMGRWLECLQFVEADDYLLGRLQSQYVPSVFDELTPCEADPPVVADPEGGWDQLKARLARDLEENGFTLPIQLLVAVRGLACLPGQLLTVGRYERGGGLAGLEAGYVERSIEKCAQAVPSLGSQRVRTMLMKLVDTGSRDDKTRSETLAKLAETLGVPEGEARKVLGSLEADGLVRRRTPDSGPSARDEWWCLYHDYLTRAVRRTEQRANRWAQLLGERHQQFEEAAGSGWRRRWSALLSPLEQFALVYHRLRGHFRYGEHRRFAVRSTLRFSTWTAVGILLLALGWLANDYRVELNESAQARELVQRIGLTTDGELMAGDALWQLAESSGRTRRKFLEYCLSDAEQPERLTQNADFIAQTLFGLDPDNRDRRLAWYEVIAPTITKKELSTKQMQFILVFCYYCYRGSEFIDPVVTRALVHFESASQSERVLLAEALARMSRVVSPELSVRVFRALLEATKNEADEYRRSEMLYYLEVFASSDRGPGLEVTHSMFDVVLDAFSTELDHNRRKILVIALLTMTLDDKSSVAKSTRHAALAADTLLRAMNGETDHRRRVDFALPLARVSAVAGPEAAGRAADVILSAFHEETDPTGHVDLAKALAGVVAVTSSEAAGRVADAICMAVTKPPPRDKWDTLLMVLGSVVKWTGPETSRRVAETLLRAFAREADTDRRRIIAKGLIVVVGQTSPTASVSVADTLLAAFSRETDHETMVDLANALAAAAERAGPTASGRVVDALLRAFEGDADPFRRANLASALGRTAAAAGPTAAICVADTLLAAFNNETNYEVRDILKEGVGMAAESAGPRATERVAKALLAHQRITRRAGLEDATLLAVLRLVAMDKPWAGSLLVAMTKEATTSWLWALSQVGSFNIQHVSARATEVLLTAFNEETDSQRRANLAAGLAATAVEPEPAGLAVDALLRALKGETNSTLRTRFAKALAVVVVQAKPEGAGQAADALLRAFCVEAGADQQDNLSQALAVAAVAAGPEMAGRAADALREAFLRPGRSDSIDLVMALGVAARACGPDAAGRAATVLLGAFNQETKLEKRVLLAQALANTSEKVLNNRTELQDLVIETLLVEVDFKLAIAQGWPTNFLQTVPSEKLVEVLKSPLCVRESRAVVLKALETHARPFHGDHFAAATWAKEYHLDVSTLPKRPRRETSPTQRRRVWSTPAAF